MPPDLPGNPPADHPDLRASDDDRERVVSRLGDHLAAGRLDAAEFEERMTSAYGARTHGELRRILADLPPAEGPAPPQHPRTPRSPAGPYARLRPYAAWLLTGGICLTIWAATSLAAGTLLSFWPFWVIVPWGAVLLLGAARGAPLCRVTTGRRRG